MVLARLGVEIRGRLYDTMILHYLLDPESRHNMDALADALPQLPGRISDHFAHRQGEPGS